VKATLFRCGTCGKRYTNPATHTCVTRIDRKRPHRRTRVTPQASITCGTCGQPYANPLTHVCTVTTDYRQQQAAAARQQKQAKAAKARKQKAALARQRKRDAAARARQRKRDAAKARPTPAAKPAGTGRPGQRAAGDGHDYRECFYASQPGRGRAAQDCDRFPCRIYREGHDLGYPRGRQRGHAEGYAEGYADGYAQGYPEGMAACPLPHGGG